MSKKFICFSISFVAWLGYFKANTAFTQTLPSKRPSFSHSQEKLLTQADLFELFSDLIESFGDRLPEDYDLSEAIEHLALRQKKPIDLNHTSEQELKELFFLTSFQINSLFQHLKDQGPLVDLLELQTIEGFDVRTVERLLPFVCVNEAKGLKALESQSFFGRGHNDLIFRYGQVLQQRKGYKDLTGNRYIGTPEKMLLRYRYSYSDILSVGLIMEKDPGEMIYNRRSVADHLSAHVTLKEMGRVRTLILGDYSLQFGQGLSLWSGFGYGKGPDVTSVAAKDIGLRPYASSNESSFLRGAATQINLSRHLDITSFLSYRKLDASLKFLSEESATLSNINSSGLHRTATEIKNQRSVSQTMYGSMLNFNNQHLNLGLLAYKSAYQHPFSTGNAAYNRYAFTGKELVNIAANYQYIFRNYFLYGETAHSLHTGWAFVHGAMISFSSKWSVVLLHRKYEKDYHTFFGQAIGEATDVSNEEGLYTGINFIPSRKWQFSLYIDYFRFPWLKYRVDSASSGREWLGQINFTPYKHLKFQLRYKMEKKQQNPDAASKQSGLHNVYKETYRIACNWSVNSKVGVQSRAELSTYQKGDQRKESGMLICQDINYKPTSAKLTGNIRLAWFDTPSYNSRIYAYEDDVLYGASSAIYYGKGLRSFINLKYSVTRHLDIWGRYAISVYAQQERIGSGLDEIDGNRKSELKFQLRYQF